MGAQTRKLELQFCGIYNFDNKQQRPYALMGGEEGGSAEEGCGDSWALWAWHTCAMLMRVTSTLHTKSFPSSCRRTQTELATSFATPAAPASPLSLSFSLSPSLFNASSLIYWLAKKLAQLLALHAARYVWLWPLKAKKNYKYFTSRYPVSCVL